MQRPQFDCQRRSVVGGVDNAGFEYAGDGVSHESVEGGPDGSKDEIGGSPWGEGNSFVP